MEECDTFIKSFGGSIPIICNQIMGSELGKLLGTTIGGSLWYPEGKLFGIS